MAKSATARKSTPETTARKSVFIPTLEKAEKPAPEAKTVMVKLTRAQVEMYDALEALAPFLDLLGIAAADFRAKAKARGSYSTSVAGQQAWYAGMDVEHITSLSWEMTRKVNAAKKAVEAAK